MVSMQKRIWDRLAIHQIYSHWGSPSHLCIARTERRFDGSSSHDTSRGNGIRVWQNRQAGQRKNDTQESKLIMVDSEISEKDDDAQCSPVLHADEGCNRTSTSLFGLKIGDIGMRSLESRRYDEPTDCDGRFS